MTRPTPRSTLFPYTTLFRSKGTRPRPLRRFSDRYGMLHATYTEEGEWLSKKQARPRRRTAATRSEEHTSELQSLRHLVCRLLLEKKKKKNQKQQTRVNDQL